MSRAQKGTLVITDNSRLLSKNIYDKYPVDLSLQSDKQKQNLKDFRENRIKSLEEILKIANPEPAAKPAG
jgi:LPS O-antigen subunit length determinant protein (WzzB/FepE family)